MGKNKHRKYYNSDYDDVIKKKKKKKKKKTYDDNDYDYSDINYSGDIRKLMNEIADSIQGYIDYIETYAIFEGTTESEWDKNMEIAKKLIKKLRKGDPSVFDIPTLNEVLASGHNLVLGVN